VHVAAATDTVALAGEADAAVGTRKNRAPPSMASPAVLVASTFEILCISHLLLLVRFAVPAGWLRPCRTPEAMMRQGMSAAEWHAR
jgi:hypothetical protein